MVPAPKPYIKNIRDLVAEKGILLPEFPQLEPDDQPITALLIQPKGEITDDESGVRNSDQDLAIGKFRTILHIAAHKNVSICISPEYSCPWSVVDEIASGAITVPPQATWYLGCESISIESLRTREAASGNQVVWLIEQIEQHRVQGQTFLDPVCIVMRGQRQATGDAVTIIAVQFKTGPMGGIDFEQNHMIRGARIYELRNASEYSTRIVCLLCSDVLQYPGERFDELTKYFTGQHRLLLLHLQLNKEPRHDLYRPYRDLVLRYNDSRSVLTLNWARDVRLNGVGAGAPTEWRNPAMSAIYSRRWKKPSLAENSIDECESRGVYFCYSHSLKAVVAILNFREYAFLLRLSKVCQEAAGPAHQTYSPPQVDSVMKWESNGWIDETLPVEADATTEMTAAHLDVAALAGLVNHPRLFERFAALSLGKVMLASDVRRTGWPCIDSVDASCLDSAESILRTTFAQDRIDVARAFRRSRYLELRKFMAIRGSGAFPKRMSPFINHTLTFEFEFPYSNIRAADGRRGTAIYLHSGNEDDASLLYTRVLKHLELLPPEGIDKDHVVIWHLGDISGSHAEVRAYPPETIPQVVDDPTPSANAVNSDPDA